MLMCYLNNAFNGGIYFKNVNDCLYYAEKLTGQNINVPIKVEKYDKHSAKEPQTTYLDADPQDFYF